MDAFQVVRPNVHGNFSRLLHDFDHSDRERELAANCESHPGLRVVTIDDFPLLARSRET